MDWILEHLPFAIFLAAATAAIIYAILLKQDKKNLEKAKSEYNNLNNVIKNREIPTQVPVIVGTGLTMPYNEITVSPELLKGAEKDTGTYYTVSGPGIQPSSSAVITNQSDTSNNWETNGGQNNNVDLSINTGDNVNTVGASFTDSSLYKVGSTTEVKTPLEQPSDTLANEPVKVSDGGPNTSEIANNTPPDDDTVDFDREIKSVEDLKCEDVHYQTTDVEQLAASILARVPTKFDTAEISPLGKHIVTHGMKFWPITLSGKKGQFRIDRHSSLEYCIIVKDF